MYQTTRTKRTLKPQKVIYRDPQLLTIVQYAAQYENSRCIWLATTHNNAIAAWAMTISHLRGQCYRYIASMHIKLLNDSVIHFVHPGSIEYIRGMIFDYAGLHKEVSVNDAEFVEVIKPALRGDRVCVRAWSPIDGQGEIVS